MYLRVVKRWKEVVETAGKTTTNGGRKKHAHSSFCPPVYFFSVETNIETCTEDHTESPSAPSFDRSDLQRRDKSNGGMNRKQTRGSRKKKKKKVGAPQISKWAEVGVVLV